MPRFHCSLPLATGADISLPPTAARHVQVLRLQPGDEVTLFDGRGGEYTATVTRMGRSDVDVHVTAHTATEREAPVAVHLISGMPANERMDWLVEKATELGAASVQPLAAARSVIKLSGERADKRKERWQAIAVSACEQCGRNRLPVIDAPVSLAEWVKKQPAEALAPGAVRVVLSLREGNRPLRELASGATDVWILHGPEGGLTQEEEDAAIAAGFAPASLGNRVLRAETAAIASLSQLVFS
ncbi:16S rRNA (uracil(1498)-N(3))-methyltransferase [Diaphorobacter caeni]|uniref:16S rRNA (uracil(1498)-N(3))-methyltransferase n=1 Tax=Diaphorobacter caeni TaxID=2784387 RepID=UPI00189095E8|nr:16S rRNA (uracil(1498)-N(3))-methyltransferase [Diaphorobacter caeni]MBF5005022.1 16S rRNA (uracil(1498)-N(3))-methyltransferase [Diaphorobacter caeni]